MPIKLKNMKNLSFLLAFLLCFGAAFTTYTSNDLTRGFVQGDPGIASVNALTFGPEGILFIGDSKNATVYAIETGDTETPDSTEAVELSGVDLKIADLLGTTAEKINIQDMAVNPVSKKVYFAVHHEDGTPVLLTLAGDTFEWVQLDDVSYNEKAIEGAVDADAKDRRGRSLRTWTVSDINYSDSNIMVSGLSNKEFASTFRSMPFPFADGQTDASLEIYHAAHGQYETESPIKSFTSATINGKNHLIAGYTCTPLVIFPVDDLKEGSHTKGRTVAELGNWNTPTDMVVMEKEGKSYLLIANTSRSVMKVDFADIEKFEGSLSTPVEERSGTAGVEFIALPFVNVMQLDRLDSEQFVMLKREMNGELNLVTQSNRWL
jgi:hypothetical protein